jgi:hypothetical protein
MATAGEITADASAAQAKKNAAYFKKLLTSMHMGHDLGAVRETEYKGHHISIRTTYEITVDGRPFNAPLTVTNAGTVHYHGMPNTGFASAVDLIKSVIDVFPDEFTPGSGGGMHMHGMDAPRARKARRPKAAKRKPAARR